MDQNCKIQIHNDWLAGQAPGHQGELQVMTGNKRWRQTQTIVCTETFPNKRTNKKLDCFTQVDQREEGVKRCLHFVWHSRVLGLYKWKMCESSEGVLTRSQEKTSAALRRWLWRSSFIKRVSVIEEKCLVFAKPRKNKTSVHQTLETRAASLLNPAAWILDTFPLCRFSCVVCNYSLVLSTHRQVCPSSRSYPFGFCHLIVLWWERCTENPST